LSPKTTFVLMILFMVVGSFAFFDPFGWEAKREEKKEMEQYVVWLKEKKLESIEIKKEEKTIQLTCKAAEGCPFDGTGNWDLISPLQDLADPSSVGSLASSILNMTFIEKVDFDSAPDPKEFGLGKAEVSWKLKGEEKTYSLVLGGAAPAGPNVYLQYKDQPNRLYVVASFFSQILEKDLFHWRNKRIFPSMESEDVAEISFQGKTTLSAKKKENAWAIESPIQAPANRIQLEGLVSTLIYLNAKSVIEKPAKYGAPQLAIQLKNKAGTEAQLKFFSVKEGKPGEWIASDGNRFYWVESYPFERFKKNLIEYRERKLFPQNTYADVEKVKFRFPREKTEVEFEKQKDQWVTKEKQKEAISELRVKSMIQRLMDAEVDLFLEKKSQAAKLFQEQTPDLEVELAGKDFQRKRRFLVVGRKSAITEGLVSEEVGSLGEAFLKVMPIRLADFYESNNKVVLPEGVKEEVEDGNDHSHGEHSGHAH
jgi:hypothetical protein